MDKTMIISKPTSTAVSKCFINFCITSIFILMIMAQAEQAVANVLQWNLNIKCFRYKI